MSKKFEHLDILANIVEGSGLENKISIHRNEDQGEWVLYHPLKRKQVKATSLSELNLMARDDLNALTWSLKKQGYGKKEPVEKEVVKKEVIKKGKIRTKKEVEKK